MSLTSTLRPLGLLTGAAAVVLGGAALPAQAAPTTSAAPATTVSADVSARRPHCDDETSYKLNKKQGWTWYSFDSGTVSNKSKKVTIHKTISHSESHSKSTTKSGEVGLSVKAWVAEINAKYGYSVSKTVAYTDTTTFTVDAPPKSKVKYKDGIIVRKFRVKITRVDSVCQTHVKYGHVYAADNLSQVKDA